MLNVTFLLAVILGAVMLNVAAPEPPLPADFVPQRHETVGKWKKQTPRLKITTL